MWWAGEGEREVGVVGRRGREGERGGCGGQERESGGQEREGGGYGDKEMGLEGNRVDER